MGDGWPGTTLPVPDQALLAAIVASSNDAIISKTLDGVIVSWNESARRMFGYTEEEAVGRPITMLVPPDRASEEAAILERLRRGEAIQNFQTVRLHKNGQRIDVSVTSSPVRNPEGRIVGASKIVRDITADKANELALAQSQSRLAGIVDSAMDAIVTVDDEGKIVVFNDAAVHMFRCDAEAARGGPLERFIPARFRSHHTELMRHFAQSGLTRRVMGLPGQIWALRADGNEFPAEASISHVDIDGHELYTVIMRDLTELKAAQSERRKLENQLRDAQKMEAIGTLAGGIAHDFNNIIASILGNIGLARVELEPDHAAQKLLDQVNRGAVRARELVRQILAFSRRQPQELANQAIRPVVDEAVALLRVTLPAIVRLDTKIAETDIHVLVDATQMHQVLLNLCTNAWHALQGSTGRIEVGLEQVLLDAPTALRLGEMPPGSYAHIWVADNGAGMDESTRVRIFEPFFTTKARGEGTGLGLSVVHGIVVDHHGAIFVETARGVGSTFHVYLPEQPRFENSRPAPLLAESAPMGAGRRVVYIDDDEIMILMVERLLQRSGYAITCYRDARLALAALRQDPGACDIVVTDYNMPECSGLEVADEMTRIAPLTPVVVTSGYISRELQDGAERSQVRALLEKENTFEELPTLLGRVLAECAPL